MIRIIIHLWCIVIYRDTKFFAIPIPIDHIYRPAGKPRKWRMSNIIHKKRNKNIGTKIKYFILLIIRFHGQHTFGVVSLRFDMALHKIFNTSLVNAFTNNIMLHYLNYRQPYSTQKNTLHQHVSSSTCYTGTSN